MNKRISFSRLWREETGQGIIFAAGGLLVLVAFVALVYNIGWLTERRTKMQVAADAASYSGAMVEANTLSAIGSINSSLAQLYYNALKYAVNMNIAGVAAEMERRQTGYVSQTLNTLTQTYADANDGIGRSGDMMRYLSQLEYSMAIVTPRFTQEEMFAVATRAGAERLSFYPSFRMYPHGSGTTSYLIERMDQGWKITNLSTGEMVYVFLMGDEWHVQYSRPGATGLEMVEEVVIRQEASDRWRISYYSPPGNLLSQILLVRTSSGWQVFEPVHDPGQGAQPLPDIEFEDVDMDGDGVDEGVRITIEGTSDILMWGDDGNMYRWNSQTEQYDNITSNEMIIEGVRVRANVTNRVRFNDYASADIGDPTEVHVGHAHLVLRDPPTIWTGMGDIRISVRGFDVDSFSVSAAGFSLTHGSANGIWEKHYEPTEELWWRHRLTPLEPLPPAEQSWQYDRQWLGAQMMEEPNMERFIYGHVLGGRNSAWETDPPAWTMWLKPETGRLANGFRHDASHFGPRDANGIQHLLPEFVPPADAYYITEACSVCGGTGRVPDPQNPPNTMECTACHALDHDPNIAGTDIRVFAADLLDENGAIWGYAGANSYDDWKLALEAAFFGSGSVRRPLVLAPEFFQFGFNMGAYKAPEDPMLFPEDRRPDWGVVALSCARIGIKDPSAPGGYRYQFDSEGERDDWCDNSRYNLYSADVRTKLFPAEEQMKDYDLDEDILIGASLATIGETPLSYIYDAVLGGHNRWETGNWVEEFEGQSDPRVNAALRNMRNRAGDVFDYRHEGLEEVVEH